MKKTNGLFLGTPGYLTGDTTIRLAGGMTASLREIYERDEDVEVLCYDDVTKQIISAAGTDARISGEVDE